MSLQSALDWLEKRVNQHKKRARLLQSKQPGWRQCFVLEVEPTHLERVRDIINGRALTTTCCSYVYATHDGDGVKRSIPPALLLTDHNAVKDGALPLQFYKFITRHFYVPHSCREANTLISHILDFVGSQAVVLKVSAVPKELEAAVIDALLDSSSVQINLSFHQTKFSHLLQVVYCGEEGGIFRFGISTAQAADDILLTSDSLQRHAAVIGSNATHTNIRDKITSAESEPVCRAYYKVLEVLEQQFPHVLNWPLPAREECICCDVGAAPGGWTQLLSTYSNKVFAIDPGLLSPSVLALDNVDYIGTTLQNSDIGNKIDAEKATNSKLKLKFIVCDVNAEARQTASILCDYLLSRLDGMSEDTVHDSHKPSPSYIVLTLKLMKNPSQNQVDRIAKRVVQIFRERSYKCHADCWTFHLMHLAANSKNERTLCMKLH